MKTHNIKKNAAQGDVRFLRVDALPDCAKKTDDKVIAHSETGHHHTVSMGDVYTTADPMISYLVLTDKPAEVVHHRSWDTHETLRLLNDESRGETIWEIRRQREYTPWGERMVVD